MEKSIGQDFLTNSIEEFGKLKKLADRALARLEAKDFHWQPDTESNSIAIIMKHIAGNMISRWTDFLTTDGEKPDRNRDGEFIDEFSSRQQLMDFWNKGWGLCFDTLNGLTEEDLLKTVYIRKEPHTVIRALQRGLSHYAYHCGQIVFI